MTTMDTENKGLSGAFGDRGTNVNSFNFGHPHAQSIIDGAKNVLAESRTGNILLAVLNKYGIPIHVMKGKTIEGTGFSPDLRTIFLSVPGNITQTTGEIVLNLAKALREVDHEFSGSRAPDPRNNLMEYAAFIHARNLDALMTTCEIVKELTNSSHFSVLLDSLTKIGLNNFYKAYLDGIPKEQLYDYYANAYDSNRGSI